MEAFLRFLLHILVIWCPRKIETSAKLVSVLIKPGYLGNATVAKKKVKVKRKNSPRESFLFSNFPGVQCLCRIFIVGKKLHCVVQYFPIECVVCELKSFS